MKSPANILIIRRRALGDVLVSLPCVRALQERWPDARIHMVVDRSVAAMLEADRSAPRLLVYDRSAMNAGSLFPQSRFCGITGKSSYLRKPSLHERRKCS